MTIKEASEKTWIKIKTSKYKTGKYYWEMDSTNVINNWKVYINFSRAIKNDYNPGGGRAKMYIDIQKNEFGYIYIENCLASEKTFLKSIYTEFIKNLNLKKENEKKTKEYLSKDISKILTMPMWKVKHLGGRLKLGYVRYGRRFYKKEHVDILKQYIKPQNTHCIICGDFSENKYCSDKCIKEKNRVYHYTLKIPCKICGKITHKKYCCDDHKKQGFVKMKKRYF